MTLTGPKLRHLWLGVPVFLLAAKSFLFPLPLLDFWWHLKMGQLILATHSIPRVDAFSFTSAGKIFVVQNWLAEILLYLVYKVGGFPLLAFLNSVLLILALIPIYHLCRRASNRLWPGIVSAGLVAISIPCNLRPQIFSTVLFALFYWILSSYGDTRRNWVWSLPALMVLWVNLHGAFVVGIGLIGIYLFGAWANRFVNPNSRARLSDRQLAGLAIVFVLCLFATLINPETYRIYTYIQTVVNDPSSQELVMEWQPPAIGSIQGLIQFYIPFFVTTLSLILASRRPEPRDLVLYLAFSAFGMTATRNSVWFLLVSAPILAKSLSCLKWSAPQARAVIEKKQSYGLNLLILGTALCILVFQSPWMQQHRNRLSLFDGKTPVSAMDYVEKSSLTGNIFHPQIYGDYLIWRLWPNQRSFFDGRVHLFGKAFVDEYRRIYHDSNWDEILSKYRIAYILLSKKEDAAEFINRVRASPRWKVLYQDSVSILFERAYAPQISQN